MLVLTVKSKETYQGILDGTFKLDFWKSRYAFLNTRFTEEYLKMNKILYNKLGLAESVKTTHFWGWSQNPFLEFYKSGGEAVAIFIEIPEKDMVFSLYDLYTSYCLEESENSNHLVEIDEVKDNDCVQCAFREITPENVKLVVDLGMLKGLNGSIESVYIATLIRLQWLRLKGYDGKVIEAGA